MRFLPEGWVYEGDDPSVGIFGHSWFHDACQADTEDPQEAEQEAEQEAVRLNTYFRRDQEMGLERITLACRDCGKRVSWEQEEWLGPCEDCMDGVMHIHQSTV